MNKTPSLKSQEPMRCEICIVAGEASGDAQAALFIPHLRQALKKNGFEPEFWGSAGPKMIEEGVDPIVAVEDLAVMGVTEVISHYFTISRCYKKILQRIKTNEPLAVIFVDYPGFNLRLLRDTYQLGITTIYHIPPKAWSHGAARIESLKKYAHLVTSILPFEYNFFHKRGVNIKFIGNPLRDSVAQFTKEHPTKRNPHQIGILPGSRKNEISKLLPTLVEAFFELHKIDNRLIARIPIAPTLPFEFVEGVVHKTLHKLKIPATWAQEHIQLSVGDAYDVLNTSIYAWVCSGTATLETAFFKTPLSSFYKLSPITAALAKWIITVKYVTLVNLCAHKEVIPEFLQKKMSVDNLVSHASNIYRSSQGRLKMTQELMKIRDSFPLNAGRNAAQAMVECILNYNTDKAKKFHLHRIPKKLTP